MKVSIRQRKEQEETEEKEEKGLFDILAPEDPKRRRMRESIHGEDVNEEGGLLDFLAPEDPEYRTYRHSLDGGSDAKTLEEMKVSIRQRKEQEEETEEKEEKGLLDILTPQGLWNLVAPEDPNYRPVRHSDESDGSVSPAQSPAPVPKTEQDGKMEQDGAMAVHT